MTDTALRAVLVGATVLSAQYCLVGPKLYPEAHVSNCTPSREARLVEPGPSWLRSGFVRAGVPWRVQPAPRPFLQALFSAPTPAEPTGWFEAVRLGLQFVCLACLGALSAKGARTIEHEDLRVLVLGVVVGGGLGAAALWGAVVMIWRSIFTSDGDGGSASMWLFTAGIMLAILAVVCLSASVVVGITRCVQDVARVLLPRAAGHRDVRKQRVRVTSGPASGPTQALRL